MLRFYWQYDEGRARLAQINWMNTPIDFDLDFKEDGIYTHGYLFSDLDFEEEFNPANPPASYGLYKLSYDGKGHTKVREAEILPKEDYLEK